uniref:Uncharacterized protein n=1 Tax=mine drainage metagenome TaxID=410659 RepID=E6Q3H7_9ZZZZ
MGTLKRSSFLGASAIAAVAATAACARSASEIGRVETAAEFDAKGFAAKVDRPADIRLVVDASTMFPPILGAIMNALNGYQFGFGIPANRIAIIAVMHGSANLMLYNDDMWTRYDLGATFGARDPNNNVIASNIFAPSETTFVATDNPEDPRGSYHKAFVGTLQQRGAIFCACNTALYEQAESIAASGKSGGKNAREVADDLRANLVPETLLVPSGVAAVGLLQYRHRYAYVTETNG